MAVESPGYKRALLNQFINFFWTILCFAPVLMFWINDGINLYFYSSIVIALIFGILPEKILNRLMLSSGRKFYERFGVKFIRKFVQNGDAVKSMTNNRNRFIINGVFQAQQYLKTIAMYERFHWVCFTFFLLTVIRCFFTGNFKLGLAISAANVVYNLCTILLQQYNKIRIKKMGIRSNY
jgi:hypothetical protein